VDVFLRRSWRGLIVAAVVLLGLANDVSAQPRRAELVLFGAAGIGDMHSNPESPVALDGFLVAERIAGAGAGVRIADRIQIESAFTVMPYRAGSTSYFVGSATVMTVRGLYLLGDATSRVRWFAGGGLGFGRHSGQETKHIFELPQRQHREVTTPFHRDGLVAEGGAGAEVALRDRIWIRFDGWFARLNDQQDVIGVSSVLMLPRYLVNLGVRF
jgi:hypothetical protein